MVDHQRDIPIRSLRHIYLLSPYAGDQVARSASGGNKMLMEAWAAVYGIQWTGMPQCCGYKPQTQGGQFHQLSGSTGLLWQHELVLKYPFADDVFTVFK